MVVVMGAEMNAQMDPTYDRQGKTRGGEEPAEVR